MVKNSYIVFLGEYWYSWVCFDYWNYWNHYWGVKMKEFKGKNYLFKNQVETYNTIENSGFDVMKLFCYANNILYKQVSDLHGSGKDLIFKPSYNQFMEDKWDIVHCEIKDVIDNVVNTNLIN